MDLLAEATDLVSPFAFANNNPVLLNDPLGLSPTDWYARINANGRVSLYQEKGNHSATDITFGQLYYNVGGDNRSSGQAEANFYSGLSAGLYAGSGGYWYGEDPDAMGARTRQEVDAMKQQFDRMEGKGYEPTTPKEALNTAGTVVGTGAAAGEAATLGAAKQLAKVANQAEDLNIARSAASASLNAAGLNTAFKVVGKVTGVLDAGVAIYDAYNTINDPNATTAAKARAVTKAAFKTALIFVRMNPIISIGLGVLDLTRATDAVFKW